jgi:predicted nucleotidyltransferase
MALQALKVAEDKIAYKAFQKVDRLKIVKIIKKAIGKFPKIEKAWIYGSFARADDNANSDIDIALKADDSFSYFDLAEIQFVLENKITRKIDVGFIDSFKPYIFDHIKEDLKLIYER